MADGVHAVMHSLQVSRGEATRDRAVAEAEAAELLARHDTVLATGQPRDPEFAELGRPRGREIGRPWAEFWTHTVHVSARSVHPTEDADQTAARGVRIATNAARKCDDSAKTAR